MSPPSTMTVRNDQTRDTSPGKSPRLSEKLRVASASESGDAPVRIMVYSHDTMGIGHMRRNLLIASHLQSEFANTTVLAITGATAACAFSSVAGVDCLALPAYTKNQDGSYASRHLSVSTQTVLKIRRQTILAAVQTFQPDVLIVDKVPGGAFGELLAALDWLHTTTRCQIILGLREILDTPDVVKTEWRRDRLMAIVRKYFDGIWIYGDPNVYDALDQYEFPPDLCRIAQHMGYLRPTFCRPANASTEFAQNHILCTVGGGQDGMRLMECFLGSAERWSHPTVLLAGPHLPARPRAELSQRARRHPHIRWVDVSTVGEQWIYNASRIVSMGGYNTVCEILASQKPALIVPRTSPRQEQLLRASRLAEMGKVAMLHPDQLSVSTIDEWVHRAHGPAANSQAIDMNGLTRIADDLARRLPALTPRTTRNR